jgi:glycosyltransferase involved in cell wall biosynthesis
MRVLHVLGKMDRAGIETWLMHVLRNRGRRSAMDFLTHASGPGEYDDEVRSLGSRIFPCVYGGNALRFARGLERNLRSQGPYDVVHSHSHFFSSLVLRVAHRVGVPIRVAHGHQDSTRINARAGLGRRLKLVAMRRWIDLHATIGLAASREAASALFGPRWERDRRWRVLHCGIDLAPFEADHPNRDRVRAELGIPADAFVIGHVGRFHEHKNHDFLIDIAAEVARHDPRSYLLLVGEGELRPAIEAKVARLGLHDRVIFAGSRSDVPRMMMGAMDTLILPSRVEGLPVVGIEAQAAGLGILLSDFITTELDIVPGLVRRLSLAAPASAWASALLLARESQPPRDPPAALGVVRRSTFNIENGVEALEHAYAEAGAVAS